MPGAITDFNQYIGLRLAAENKDPAVLREVAGQFEALFIQSLMKNMREASLGDPVFGNSDQHDMYQEMMDQQLAVEMASGKGIGLADMLVRQLGGGATPSSSANGTAPVGTADTKTPFARSVNKLDKMWSDAKSFAADVWPHAKRIARQLDVAPEGILAQVALETGWGAHVPQRSDGDSSFNLFGIKAGGSWDGETVAKTTIEFEAGLPRMEVHKFRAYDDIGRGFDDYSDLLSQNPRYEAVKGNGADAGAFADALQASGYATDPSYADKIKSVLRSPTMQMFLGEL